MWGYGGGRCAKCFHLASFGNRIIFGHSAASDSIGSVAILFLHPRQIFKRERQEMSGFSENLSLVSGGREDLIIQSLV